MQEINDILDAKLLEFQKSQEKRNYIGASMIGEECLRKVQLQYMHKQPEICNTVLHPIIRSARGM